MTAVLLVVVSAAACALAPVTQSTGSLRVFIAPPEAVDAGAMWRITNLTGIEWQRSGATLSNIRAGNYTVEFSDASGWQTPASQRVSIERGKITVLDVEYRSQTGSLVVYIEPANALDVGAMWRREGTELWHRSGEREDYVPEGDWVIEFVDIKDWEKPAALKVAVSRDRTVTVRATYEPMWGSLTVTIDPTEAGNAGALWRRQGTAKWFRAGETETEIPSGDYTIEFLDLKYWDKSPVRQVRIDSGQTATATGLYRIQRGVLTINIEPKEALDDGAEWRLKGEDDWHRSGRTLQNAPAGENIVQLKSIAGWNKPEEMSVLVDPRRPTTKTITYVMEKGALTVNIEPSEAAEGGARWRIDEEGYNWRNSGTTKTNMSVGVHTIEFKEVDGWETPETQKIRVTESQALTITGRYKAMRGSLTVNLEPQGAIDEGAEWRIVGTPNWHSSGRLRESIRSGDWVIEFKDIPNWNKPDNFKIVLNPGEDVTVTGVYRAERRATLTVTIEPRRAVTDGAMWRIAGTQEWLESGRTVDNVTPGQVTIEFKNAPEWKKPDDLVVTVNPREEAQATATYERKR